MLKATIELSGETTDDLLLAMDAIAEAIGDDYTSGRNRNETGSYTFEVEEVSDAADSGTTEGA